MANEGKIRNLLTNLMDNISDQIYFKDRESKFIMVNKASAGWHRQDRAEDVIGLTDFDIYKEADACRMQEDEHRILETGKPLIGIEEHEVWQDGTEAWVSTSKMPLRDENGEIIGTFGISRDITEHKNAEMRARKLGEENLAFRQRVEQELQIAAQLQKTFFPREYPTFPEGVSPGYSAIRFHHTHISGEEVGGDLCSVFRLSESKAAVFLCDVMGHGVRAALGTALVRALIEETVAKEEDPSRILREMNRQLYSMLQIEDERIFVTACCMVIDVKTGCLEVASAGHPMPVYLGKDHAEWLFPDDAFRGPALALCDEMDYRTVSRSVEPGDAVVMFTDGMFEVKGLGDQEFGEERLLQSFQWNRRSSLSELFPAIINEVSGFSESGTFEDDICMVGLRWLRPM